jgi:hypothetical protein
MDKQRLKSNPIFRLGVSNLKKKYPFIIGYNFPSNYDEQLSEYPQLIFINIVYSIPQIVESENLTLEPYMKDWFKYNDSITSSLLWVPFVESDRDELKFIQEDIETILNSGKSLDVFRSEDQFNRDIIVEDYIGKNE